MKFAIEVIWQYPLHLRHVAAIRKLNIQIFCIGGSMCSFWHRACRKQWAERSGGILNVDLIVGVNRLFSKTRETLQRRLPTKVRIPRRRHGHRLRHRLGLARQAYILTSDTRDFLARMSVSVSASCNSSLIPLIRLDGSHCLLTSIVWSKLQCVYETGEKLYERKIRAIEKKCCRNVTWAEWPQKSNRWVQKNAVKQKPFSTIKKWCRGNGNMLEHIASIYSFPADIITGPCTGPWTWHSLRPAVVKKLKH